MSTEPTKDPESLVYEGDYRITRGPDGIKIEVLAYHADPLVLTDEVLQKLGVTIGTIDGTSQPKRDH